jgi:hypothetical protein
VEVEVEVEELEEGEFTYFLTNTYPSQSSTFFEVIKSLEAKLLDEEADLDWEVAVVGVVFDKRRTRLLLLLLLLLPVLVESSSSLPLRKTMLLLLLSRQLSTKRLHKVLEPEQYLNSPLS